jgi:hypothetical protein
MSYEGAANRARAQTATVAWRLFCDVKEAFKVSQRPEHDVEDGIIGVNGVATRYYNVLVVDDSMRGSKRSVSHGVQQGGKAAETPDEDHA